MKKWIKKSLLLICTLSMATFTAVAVTGCRKKSGGHTHVWDNGTVTKQATCTTRGEITYNCTKCDETKVEGTGFGHNYETVVTDPTCVKDGYSTYTCTNCGYVTTDNFVEATGHTYAKTTTQATCTLDGYNVYTCECGEEYREVTERAKGHTADNANWTVSGEDLRQGETCEYLRTEITNCKDCEEPVTKSYTVQKHEYSVAITTAATCTTAGVKTFTCSCGDSYTEAYEAVATAHAWNDGVQQGNLKVYTCTHDASHTKTEVSLLGETTVSVPSEALTQKDVELKMDNATMKMDDTLRQQVGADVQLTAEKLDQTDATVSSAVNAMSEENKARLGDNKIFNFGLTSGGNAVNFNNGKMTVSVPYELSAGEDPDSIAIWYINNDGTVKMYEAVWANGFATFEADHFSYYTVVRMTPEERCAKYGHSWTTTVMAATCTEDGYTLKVCKKCNVSVSENFKNATGHNYQGEVTNPTCTERGYTTYVCANANCGDTYVSNYVNALSHNYVDTVKAPTCTAKGYTSHVCENCHKTMIDTYVDALGHTYKKGECEVCGSPDPDAITVDNFYLQLLNSFQSFENGVYVEMKDLDIVINMPAMDEDYIEDGVVSQQMEVRAKLGQFMFTLGEDGMPVGKAEADTLMITTYIMQDGSEVKETMESHMKLVFKDGKMYMYSDVYEGNRVEYMYQYAVMDFDMESMMGSMGNVSGLLGTLDEDVKSIVENILSTKNNPANTLLERLVNYLFVREETPEGYEFSVNYEKIPEVIGFFSTATVKSTFDLAFGEGKYDAFVQWVVNSLDKTVEEVLDDVAVKATKLGIDLQDVYDMLDVVLAQMSMEEGQTEPITVDQMIEQYSQDTIVNMLIAMAEAEGQVLTKEQAVATVEGMLDNVGNKLLTEAVGMLGGMSGGSMGGGSVDGNGGDFSENGGIIGEETEKEEILDKKLAAVEKDDGYEEDNGYAEGSAMDMMTVMGTLLADISNIFGDTVIGFTTDKLGNVISMNVNLDIDYALDLASMMAQAIAQGEGTESDEAAMEISVLGTGSMQVIPGGEYAAEYNDLVAKIESAKQAFNFTAGTKFENSWMKYEVAIDNEGTRYIVPAFNANNAYNMGGYPEEDVVNGQTCQKYVYSSYNTTYVLDNDVSFRMSNSCTGWTEYSLVLKAYYNTIFYVWKVEENSREILKYEIAWDLMKLKYNSDDGNTSSFYFYYNQKKNVYKYGEEPHNYRVVQKVEGTCAKHGYTVYTCTVCGDTYKSTDYIPHTEKVEYVLKSGSVSCTDGVECIVTCTVCEQQVRRYDIQYHAMMNKFEALEGSVCGNLGLRWQECACGENISYGYWEHDEETGYSQWYDYVDGDCLFANFSNVSFKGTYRCAISNCGYTYTVETWQTDGAKDCETVHHTLYKFGVKEDGTFDKQVEFEDVSYKHTTTTRDLGADTTLQLDRVYEEYCTVCGEVTDKYGYSHDKFGRTLRSWNYNNKYGYIYEYNEDCSYMAYAMNADGSKGRQEYGGTNHVADNDYYQIGQSCSQYGVSYRGCDACETYEYSFKVAPKGHNYTYDAVAGIHFCEECGMENKTGADGNFFLEDLSDPAGYQVGFFNRGNEEFEFHITVDGNPVTDVEYEFRYYVVSEDEVDVKCGVVIIDMDSVSKYDGKVITVEFEYYDRQSDSFLVESVTFE